MLAVGKPSLRPAPVPLDDLPSSRKGAPRHRPRPRHLPGGDQRPDPGRGDDLAIDLHQRHDPGLELVVRGEHLGVPPAPWRRSGSSPPPRRSCAPSPSTRIRRRSPRPRCEENSLVERDHDQLLDPQPLDHVALDLERHDQLRRRLRVKHAQRMRLEGQHRVAPVDHLAVTDVDAVEDRRSPRCRDRASASASCVTLMFIEARRKPFTGAQHLPLRRATSASSAALATPGDGQQRPSWVSLSGPRPRRQPARRARGTRSASSARRIRSGRKASAASTASGSPSAASTRNGPTAVRRSRSQ